MRYTAFFWDFDGTLYDTYGRITRATQKALADLGVACSCAEVYQQVKRSLHVAYETLAAQTGCTEEEYMAAYHRHAEEEGADSIRPYPGTAEMLRAVVNGGGQNFLYTHRGLSAWENLRRDGLDGLFAGGVTSADHFPGKPAPDALNYLAEKYALDKARCVMIGDRDIDCDAGKNAGMACILFDPDHFYPGYQADGRFAGMDEMRRALTE